MDPTRETLIEAAERIYHAWDSALQRSDVAGIMALYHPDVTIESPLIAHVFGVERGICQGQAELRRFIEMVVKRKPKQRKYYRAKYFSDGKTLMWEYPRMTPTGEQMDYAEIMELEDGLIRHHKVYWGWYGVNVLNHNQYHA